MNDFKASLVSLQKEWYAGHVPLAMTVPSFIEWILHARKRFLVHILHLTFKLFINHNIDCVGIRKWNILNI